MDAFGVKMKILSDNLREKHETLNLIYNITDNQNMLLESPNPDNEIKLFFNEMIKEKQTLIDKVIDLDRVFQGMFEEIGDSFELNAPDYREIVLEMQNNINLVMEMDVKIRAMEKKNKELVENRSIKPAPNQAKGFKGNVLEEYKKNSKKEEPEPENH